MKTFYGKHKDKDVFNPYQTKYFQSEYMIFICMKFMPMLPIFFINSNALQVFIKVKI